MKKNRKRKKCDKSLSVFITIIISTGCSTIATTNRKTATKKEWQWISSNTISKNPNLDRVVGEFAPRASSHHSLCNPKHWHTSYSEQLTLHVSNRFRAFASAVHVFGMGGMDVFDLTRHRCRRCATPCVPLKSYRRTHHSQPETTAVNLMLRCILG